MRGVVGGGSGGKTPLVAALFAACDFFFAGTQNAGSLILRFRDGEEFVYWGAHTSPLDGVTGTVSKVLKYIPGHARKPANLPPESLRYGFVFVITCQRDVFKVRSINLQKLARHLTLTPSPNIPRLRALPALAMVEPWPFEERAWTEVLRRLLSSIELDGRQVQRFDGQTLRLPAQVLQRWRRREKPVGCKLRVPMFACSQTYTMPPNIEFTNLGPLRRAKAY
eukprot:Gregarina_sp_Pseudo_9__187@NODE_1121_length_1861_cov_218_725027_g1048_i0_p1_GENE_NODE_1121_length_1861_cov_218_725027_g1048_i0NODE_1121_length_1861_cov_218_725027_g1048_i0_p1_ORF_typecomplete_len223_score32_81_NODE_1121_length_1861_cov_218_725027_g1048_i011601828